MRYKLVEGGKVKWYEISYSQRQQMISNILKFVMLIVMLVGLVIFVFLLYRLDQIDFFMTLVKTGAVVASP